MNDINIHTSQRAIEELLIKKDWLSNEQVIDIDIPGEGNMNVVLRVRTTRRTFILKQSRPFVRKYEQVPAPLNRIETEYQFYHAVRDLIVQMPQIFAYDAADHLLMMEDLGHTEDMTRLYRDRHLEDQHVAELIAILLSIHRTAVPEDYPRNMELRTLNHQHIFVLPFMENNGFDLDAVQSGLRVLADQYKPDVVMAGRITEIGRRYLSPGSHLLHGDYYPGSWMESGKGLFVLDPEFSFAGFREFDIGVMGAHLFMATMDEGVIDTVFDGYDDVFDKPLAIHVAAIEVMRRLMGLAQLPMHRTLKEKEWLLETAKKWLQS